MSKLPVAVDVKNIICNVWCLLITSKVCRFIRKFSSHCDWFQFGTMISHQFVDFGTCQTRPLLPSGRAVRSVKPRKKFSLCRFLNVSSLFARRTLDRRCMSSNCRRQANNCINNCRITIWFAYPKYMTCLLLFRELGTLLDTPSVSFVSLLEQRLYRCRYGVPTSHSDAEYCV